MTDGRESLAIKIYILRISECPVISANYFPNDNNIMLEGAQEVDEIKRLSQNNGLIHVGSKFDGSSPSDEVFAVKPDGYDGSIPVLKRIVEAAVNVVRKVGPQSILVIKNEIVSVLPQ